MKEKRKMTAKEKNEAMWGYLFVAPTIIGLIVLNFYPAFNTVWQSFCKTGDFGKGNTFVGFANYAKAFQTSEVWQSLLNTIKYAIIEVPFGVIIALILAVFLNKKLKGTSFFRTVFFLPMVCAPAAVAMVWKWLYNQQFGLFNNLLHTNTAWISDPKIAWISVGIIGVWSIIGYNMVLFISGLQVLHVDPFPKLFHRADRRVDAQIRQDQALLQVVIEIVVNAVESGKHAADGTLHGMTRFAQALPDSFKKTH